MPFVKLETGITLYYESHGDHLGPPVVFISGGSAAGSIWMPQVEEYRHSYRCVIFDNRGVGQSDSPRGPYSTLMLARDTFALMDKLGIERAHLSGVSMGSSVAVVMALEAPGRVATLQLQGALSGPRHDSDKPWASVISRVLEAGGLELHQDFAFLRWISADFIVEHPDRALKIYKIIKQSKLTLEGVRGQLANVESYDFRHRLGEISCPTLITVGDRDMMTPLPYGRELHEGIHGSQLLVIPGAGHLISLQDPETFNRVTMAWLAETNR